MNRTCFPHGKKICWLVLAGAAVAGAGSGDSANVQAAVNAAPVNGSQPVGIVLKPGANHGHAVVPADRPCLTSF